MIFMTEGELLENELAEGEGPDELNFDGHDA